MPPICFSGFDSTWCLTWTTIRRLFRHWSSDDVCFVFVVTVRGILFLVGFSMEPANQTEIMLDNQLVTSHVESFYYFIDKSLKPSIVLSIKTLASNKTKFIFVQHERVNFSAANINSRSPTFWACRKTKVHNLTYGIFQTQPPSWNAFRWLGNLGF